MEKTRKIIGVVILAVVLNGNALQINDVDSTKPFKIERTISSKSDIETGHKNYAVRVALKSSQTMRIHTRVVGRLNSEHPVEFTARQPGSRLAWDIPNKLASNSSTANKTLCPFSGNQTIDIIVSTSSKENQTFQITVTVVDFVIEVGKKLSGSVSPMSPQVYRFNFPEKIDNLLLKVTSEKNKVCSVVSVQPGDRCPLYDDESNYKFGSVYQTMLELSAVSLNLDRDTFKDGVNIILLVKTTDKACYHRHEKEYLSPLSDRVVDMTVEVVELDQNSVMATLVTVGFYVCVGLIASCFTFCGFDFDSKFSQFGQTLDREVRRKSNASAFSSLFKSIRFPVIFSCQGNSSPADQVEGVERSIEMKTKEGSDARIKPGENEENSAVNNLHSQDAEDAPFLVCWQQQQTSPLDQPDAAIGTAAKSVLPNLEECVRSRHSSGNHPAVKKVVEIDKTKVKIWREHPDVTVAFMSLEHDRRRFPNSMRMRSEMFGWLIIIVGIYYTLPVFQLVFHHQETTQATGDKDTCYYNYLCLYPMGIFEDHGHIFSNIGYIISGIFFILVVWYRSIKYNKLCKKWEKVEDKLGPSHVKNPTKCGIPEQYGIYYAMGGALAMEGVLSGCYHICPTRENFQFDTTFMYLISVLVFLKVYQFRHADITQNAYLVFLYVGIALVFEVIGYYTDHWVFWAVFGLVYVLSVILFVIQVYYNGTGVKDKLKKVWESLKNCENIGPSSWTKLLLPSLIVIFINVGIAFFFLFKNKAGVSRYILIILMLNMIMYVCSYIAKKLFWRFRPTRWRASESFRKTTMIYGLASMAFMLGAVYFFVKELKSGSGTPAQSRNLNDVCAVSIYDNHDLWHFLSAAGLFMGFMFILTMEDHNMAVPRKNIPVF